MKRILSLVCVLAVVGPAVGQESDVTEITTTTTTVTSDVNLLDELWFMQDATPVNTGQVDLRLTFRWVSESFPANLGDSGDDFVIQPSIFWGSCENVQVSLSVPVWVGDGGDIPALEDGNADTYVGILWRLADQADPWPAVALSGNVRVPTGDDSNGMDGELGLVLTNEYDSGLRSHVNAFAQSVNTDNDWNLRHFQWGLVVGMDGPLCGDGAVRWVADYMHRSSEHYGLGNMNVVELGWEWAMADAQKLGLSMQVGLDRTGDNPNFGAAVTYAHSLTY